MWVAWAIESSNNKRLTNTVLFVFHCQMTSVERILNYGKLKLEAEEKPDSSVPANWPSEGAIVFDNVTLSYNKNHKPALQHFSIAIKRKEKVLVLKIKYL